MPDRRPRWPIVDRRRRPRYRRADNSGQHRTGRRRSQSRICVMFGYGAAPTLPSMVSPVREMSERQAALTAGLAFAAMAVLAIFANFYVLGTLVHRDDPVATMDSIRGSVGLFRA